MSEVRTGSKHINRRTNRKEGRKVTQSTEVDWIRSGNVLTEQTKRTNSQW